MRCSGWMGGRRFAELEVGEAGGTCRTSEDDSIE